MQKDRCIIIIGKIAVLFAFVLFAFVLFPLV